MLRSVSGEKRRYRRVPYIGPVRVGWSVGGEIRYASAKCIDVSGGGLRLEVPVPVPLLTGISLNADRINVSGSARVRHMTRYGAKYLIGVELSQALQEKVMAALGDPKTVSVL
jgi:hypothetical protein